MRRRLAMWLLRPDLEQRKALAQLWSQEAHKQNGQGRFGRVFWNGYLRALEALSEEGM